MALSAADLADIREELLVRLGQERAPEIREKIQRLLLRVETQLAQAGADEDTRRIGATHCPKCNRPLDEVIPPPAADAEHYICEGCGRPVVL
jgi:uncharacterized protein with PIN domain